MIEKNWKELVKPSKLDIQSSDDKSFAKITVEPLEKGFALTLGNALRRILLSSIQGTAVTAIQIDGVLHEFSSINGVREDVTDIVLNIKALSLNDFSDSNLFSEDEVLAIKWAEAVTNNTAADNDDLFNQLKKKFTEKQIVEMTILCAMFNMINRINDSLDVDLEEQEEVNLIKKSLRLKSEAYGNYLEWFAKFWKRNIS